MYDKLEIDKVNKIIKKIKEAKQVIDLSAIANIIDYSENKVPNGLKHTDIQTKYQTKKTELTQKEADQTARTTAITEVNNH
jgi:hypothetical protein